MGKGFKVTMKLKDKISEITKKHLLDGNLLYGQCLTAVGNVGGTVPDMEDNHGIVELSMADVAGGAFVVGGGLMGKRPIYVIRYQGFSWYNMISIVNYAAKSKEMWGVPCPILVRSIAMEGAIGPVAGSSHHSAFYRMPGIKIYSPMTPGEYQSMYDDFMQDDSVYYVSEHRGAYDVDYELNNITFEKPDVCLYPVSITRLAAMEVSKRLQDEGINVAVYHQRKLTDHAQDEEVQAAAQAKVSLVLDDDYSQGVATNIAYNIQKESDIKLNIFPLGLEKKSAGFAKHLDNLPPDANKIYDYIKGLL